MHTGKPGREQKARNTMLQLLRKSSLSVIITFFSTGFLFAGGGQFVFQSERMIPVIANVDIVIVGGSTAAVAAAESAANSGADVFLAAPRPYLGEDMCATLRLEAEAKTASATPLAKKLFSKGNPSAPGHIKAVLAQALVSAGVRFKYGSYATDIIADTRDSPCGVVIVNRGGRQAVVGKIIIDATPYAWTARLAGCSPKKWSGNLKFYRSLLTGKRAHIQSRVDEFLFPMKDMSYASLAGAEQSARDKTKLKGVLRSAEMLFCIPPEPVKGSGRPFGTVPPGFQTKNHPNLFVLSGCADIPRKKAEKLLKPGAMIGIGSILGKAAAACAKRTESPKGAHVRQVEKRGSVQGDVKEVLSGGRPIERKLPEIESNETALPVLGTYDVVVIGGGTSGAPAAIAAAEKGARTLVVEYLQGLGGMGTLGLINKAYHGKRRGFAKDVPFSNNIELKMEWFRSRLRKGKADIWFHSLGCGAFTDRDTVRGAVVGTPEGRGVVLAGCVIDATGNGDIAIAAGADYMYGAVEKGDIALQGTGMSTWEPGAYYNNSDYLLVDESDTVDVWRALTGVFLAKGKKGYDIVPLVQTRERRRIVGDFVMRYTDQIAGRTYPDSIVFSGSDYDSHGYPSVPYFALLPHDNKSKKANHPAPGGTCWTPYRCLLPKGLDNILVTGLAISMERDASAMVRMQLDMANQGYAAGIAAAAAARGRTSPRRIHVRNLQQELIRKGNLPRNVLSHQDSFPLPDSEILKAVQEYGSAVNPETAGRPLAVIMSHMKKAHTLIRRAIRSTKGKEQLLYAQVLGILGDPAGVPILINALKKVKTWDKKIYQGRMAEYAHLPTPADSIILALGYAGSRKALPVLIEKLKTLSSNVTLSHHRSLALAFERFGYPEAARPLADLLKKPGMTGHALTDLVKSGKLENRIGSFREIVLARALYRCGDHKGIGRKILEEYSRDLRGLFARHAQAVLSGEQRR